MALLLSLLAALAGTPEVPSPVNPMAGVAPDRVASVLVRRLIVGFRSVDLEDCTIGREGAQAFAAAVARARPQPSQHGTFPAGLVMWIRLTDGRNIGVIGGDREIYRDGPPVAFMIDGWNYEFDRSSLRAMHAAMMRCEGYHLSPG